MFFIAVITDADGRRVAIIRLCVILSVRVCPLDKTKTAEIKSSNSAQL